MHGNGKEVLFKFMTAKKDIHTKKIDKNFTLSVSHNGNTIYCISQNMFYK